MIVTKRGLGSGGRGCVGRAGGRRAGWRKTRERRNGAQTTGAVAYGKIVWIRRLDAGVKSCGGAESPTGPRCRFP